MPSMPRIARATTPDPDGDPLGALRNSGWRADLNVLPDGGLRCSACGATSAPQDVTAVAFHQVEGASDPDDRAIAAACACPSCGTRAVVLAHVGAHMEVGVAEALGALRDGRDGTAQSPAR